MEIPGSGQRAVVGMSGGVDSAVSALLLKRAGLEVSGLFMRNWDEPAGEGPCPWAVDARDALAACEHIGIDLDAVSFVERYRERVFARFLEEYRAGRTPNPDVLCNSEIKFRAFLDHALAGGAAWMATGHYARIERRDGRCVLLKGADPHKDQSYFLHGLTGAQLARAIFPLGAMLKRDVRLLARAAGLANHDRRDSTGICFIGERHFRAFLARFLPARPGEIRSDAGELLGGHDGLMFHTLGQRKGLRIGGRRDGSGEPWFVVAKDLATNTLVVGQGGAHPLLFSTILESGPVHWIGPTPDAGAILRCAAKTRYRQSDQACTVEVLDAGRCRVRFDAPQRAVTPGQSVVFYAGAECLGGGVIERVADAGAVRIAPGVAAHAGERVAGGAFAH